MKTTELKKQISEVYSSKGLNGVHNFLKRNNISYKQTVEVFGLHTRKGTFDEKREWLNEETDDKTFRFHYYSRGLKSRRNGYGYNEIRGTQIVISNRSGN